MTVDCPRCYKSRWHATGRFNLSRHNLRRAELICEVCSYAFSSAIAEAITAGETAARLLAPAPPAVEQPRLPGVRVLPPLPMTPRDFKSKQAGDE